MSDLIAETTIRAWLHALLGLEQDHTPFPWQLALLDRLREGQVPSALDIHTDQLITR